MKTLSIRQPWAWLVVNGWKNIENCERRFSHRGPLLIHAAAWMTPADYEACRIFVDGICDDLALPAMEELPRGGIVGEVVVCDCGDQHNSPWFSGTHGLVLDEACRCDFIKWRGMPGLFDVPIRSMENTFAPTRPSCEVCGHSMLQAMVGGKDVWRCPNQDCDMVRTFKAQNTRLDRQEDRQ
jgi:hypothetical protein